MALSTTHVVPARIRLKIGSQDYWEDLAGLQEIVQETGGGVTDVAAGALISNLGGDIIGCTLTFIQGLTATTQIMDYLRENDSAGTETLTYCWGTSYTASATNPIYLVTLTGWTKPPYNWVAGTGGPPTTSCRLSFSAPPVADRTP